MRSATGGLSQQSACLRYRKVPNTQIAPKARTQALFEGLSIHHVATWTLLDRSQMQSARRLSRMSWSPSRAPRRTRDTRGPKGPVNISYVHIGIDIDTDIDIAYRFSVQK